MTYWLTAVLLAGVLLVSVLVESLQTRCKRVKGLNKPGCRVKGLISEVPA